MQVGNGLTDDYYNHLGSFQYMWINGLISDETYNLLNTLCVSESYEHISSKCQMILDLASKEIGNIDTYSIFASTCTGTTTQSKSMLNKLFVSIIHHLILLNNEALVITFMHFVVKLFFCVYSCC